MELEVVYSGSLDRAGLCPSLSSYIGGSTAGATIAAMDETPRRASPTPLPIPVELPSYGQVTQRVRRGHSVRSTARFFKIRISDVRRLLRKARVEAEGRARRAETSTE
jgi:hypothetical protein